MPEHQLSPAALPEEIRSAIGTIDSISFPAQGMTSHVIILHGQHGIFVAKRATQRRYRSWLQQEYAVLQALAETTLPVPRAHLCVPDARDDQESWLLMDYLPGESLRAALRNTPDRWAREALLISFGRLLQRVHDCPLPAALRQEESAWTDRTVEQAAFALAHEVVDGTPELLAYVRQNRPSGVPEALIHGDCTLDNLLVDNGAVTSLIDWASGGQGDPRHDLALATQVEREAFQSASDYDAFYAGYAGERLTEAEHSYFLALDEFF